MHIGKLNPEQVENKFDRNLQIHTNFNVKFLRVPIGSDCFVQEALKKKLKELESIIQSAASMPQKHEGFTLIQKCASQCRVVHLARTLPPRQSKPFIIQFDKLLRQGFEKLLGIPVSDKWWRQAKLPSKFGGMAIQSGLATLGSQHLISVIKAWDHVSDLCQLDDKDNKISLKEYCDKEIKSWLNRQLDYDIDLNALIENDGAIPDISLKNRHNEYILPRNAQKLSLGQLCVLKEKQRVHSILNDNEKIHVEAVSGSTHHWVRQTPLKWMGWNMEPEVWVAAARRRLFLDVVPSASACPCCKWGRCDTKGNHSVVCSGLGSTRMRHDAIRDLIVKEAQSCGYTTGIEHHGDLGDKRRPGDVIIYNWNRGKHLLIDVAVVSPKAEAHLNDLI